MMKIFVNLVLLNGERFWIDENIFNIVPINGEEIQNDENLISPNRETDNNFEIIWNMPIPSQ